MARCTKSPRIMPQSIARFASNERLTWRKTHPHLYLFSMQSALKGTTILIIKRLEKSLKTRVFASKRIIIWNKGSFQKGFVKEYLTPTPIPSPREGGANLQGKSSLCYGFPSHSNPLINNKESCNFNLSPREGSPNLQGKSSLCYGFPSYSNPLVNNKESCNFNLASREGSPKLQENHHCTMAFQAIATHWLTTKRAATLTSPQGRGTRTCKENHHCTMAFQAIATRWLQLRELQL